MTQNPFDGERFIHDELVRRAEHAVAKIPDMWRMDRRIYATILLWPTDEVRTTNGGKFTGTIFAELPNFTDATARSTYLQKAAEQCGAYALLVTEQLQDAVRSIFESTHGTVTWRLPIKDYGGAKVLGAAARRTNAESLGVLWRMS